MSASQPQPQPKRSTLESQPSTGGFRLVRITRTSENLREGDCLLVPGTCADPEGSELILSSCFPLEVTLGSSRVLVYRPLEDRSKVT